MRSFTILESFFANIYFSEPGLYINIRYGLVARICRFHLENRQGSGSIPGIGSLAPSHSFSPFSLCYGSHFLYDLAGGFPGANLVRCVLPIHVCTDEARILICSLGLILLVTHSHGKKDKRYAITYNPKSRSLRSIYAVGRSWANRAQSSSLTSPSISHTDRS